MSISLSAELRSFVNVHVSSVDQLTFEEYSRSISNPSALAIFDLEPLAGSAILEFGPEISFAILDRLMGA